MLNINRKEEFLRLFHTCSFQPAPVSVSTAMGRISYQRAKKGMVFLHQEVCSICPLLYGKGETMSDLIKREDAIRAVSLSCGTCLARNIEDCEKCSVPKLRELINVIPSADRPQGEWIDCKELPSTGRNVFIAYGTDNMKSVCIGHYEHDMKLWYEDKNFFAKPIYDAMYWCEIPQFPTRMKGADDD